MMASFAVSVLGQPKAPCMAITSPRGEKVSLAGLVVRTAIGLKNILVDVSDIFLFFSPQGGGRERVRGAGRGGSVFFINLRRGGLQRRGRGQGAGRVSAANWGILGGGGKFFFGAEMSAKTFPQKTITRVSRNPTFAQIKKGPRWRFSIDFPVFKAEKGPQKICANPWLPVIRA